MQRAFALAFCLASPALGQAPDAQTVPGSHPPLDDVGCTPKPLTLPQYVGAVDLSGQPNCAAGQSLPWSLAYSPQGDRLYVTLFGGLIGAGGCLVAHVDPTTLQVVNTIPVGQSPEEIAFTTHPSGLLRYGFVTDSSDSTVTVFDVNDQVVATIPIPITAGSQYPTAFPFGLAVSPDQRTMYVGTLDGSGCVYAIDVGTLMLDPAKTFCLGMNHGFGRLMFVGDELVIPATFNNPAVQGSVTKLFFVDPDNPAAATHQVLFNSARSSSAEDVALDPCGRLYVGGFDMGAAVYVFDAETQQPLGTIPTNTTIQSGKYQGLGISPDGLLVVAGLFLNELSLIDTWYGSWWTTLTQFQIPGNHAQPNEVVFSPDGSQMAVVYSSTDNVAIFNL